MQAIVILVLSVASALPVPRSASFAAGIFTGLAAYYAIGNAMAENRNYGDYPQSYYLPPQYSSPQPEYGNPYGYPYRTEESATTTNNEGQFLQPAI